MSERRDRESETPVGVAVIGVGRMGRHHARVYHDLPGANLLAAFSAGAYGIVMASHYNAMPYPPEVLVHDDRWTLIRRRETYDDLIAAERIDGPVETTPRATVESIAAAEASAEA